MSEKRRDHRGRILKTGESQRKDLSYQYRYTDTTGKRITVYAPTLNELREKEKNIQIKLDQGIVPSRSDMTLLSLLEEYLPLKQNLRDTSKHLYENWMRSYEKDPFFKTPISKIKPLDVRKWLIRLSDDGYARGTLMNQRCLIKAAYDMAIENDYVIKNPFAIKMDFIPNSSKNKEALTEEEQRIFFDYISHSRSAKYMNMCTVLVETGLRAGELCGLTIGDIDFEQEVMNVTHQVVRVNKDVLIDAPLKTEAGKRTIPLTSNALMALRDAVDYRLAKDGASSGNPNNLHVFKTIHGKVFTTGGVDDVFRAIRKEYEKQNIPLPRITPHILRHTFCTNMINQGVPPKHVQYLMGHSNIGVTMNVYTSVDASQVAKSMKKLSIID